MNKSFRILTVANVPPNPNSGAAGTVWHTNVALRELGHTVDEIWADQLGPRRIQHGNLHSLLEQPRTYQREIKKVIAKTEYDVIQISQPQAWLASKYLKQSGFRGLVINRSHGLELRVNAVLPTWHQKMKVPESQFPRSLMTPLLRKGLQKQWHRVIHAVDGIVLTNKMDRDFLLNNTSVDEKKLFVIHHGVPAEFIQKNVPEMSSDRLKHLLYVGQFSFIKGYHILVDILNQLLEKNPTLIMTWVTADSAHSQIREMLNQTVRDRVKLLPWCDQEKLIDLYDQHGVFIFPSFFEGAGKAALEAMSRGLCVVASNTGAMSEYIHESGAGTLCPVGDVSSFVLAIEKFVQNHNFSQETSTKSAQYANEKTWTQCAENYTKMYRSLLSG